MSRDEPADKKSAAPNDEWKQSDELVQQEGPEEPEVTPDEVWDQLSPDVQERAKLLLSRMAYKYALTKRGSSSKEKGEDDEIQCHESEDHV